MPRPYASSVIPAPVDDVWTVVRDYNGLGQWHPAIADSALDSGTAEVGAVRRLTLGATGEWWSSGCWPSTTSTGATPTRSWRALSRCAATSPPSAPITDSGQTFAEWWAEYDAEGADESGLDEFFSGAVYGDGLAALRERFGSAAR